MCERTVTSSYLPNYLHTGRPLPYQPRVMCWSITSNPLQSSTTALVRRKYKKYFHRCRTALYFLFLINHTQLKYLCVELLSFWKLYRKGKNHLIPLRVLKFIIHLPDDVTRNSKTSNQIPFDALGVLPARQHPIDFVFLACVNSCKLVWLLGETGQMGVFEWL